MKSESFVKKHVEKAEEDELQILARIRHSKDWQKYIDTYGADYLLALIIPAEDERELKKTELMRLFQKYALAEVNRRKTAELKEAEKRRKQNLQSRLKKYGELRKAGRIIVWSRRKAKIEFQDDGTFNHHCPGWFTNRREQTQRCQEIHKISLITEEELVHVTQPFLTDVTDKGKRVLAFPKIGPRVGTGNLPPILTSIIGGDITMLVIRCGHCNTSDDLKISLKKE